VRKWVPVAAVLAVATTASVAGFTWTNRPQPAPEQRPEAPQIAQVVKTDLSDAQDFKGDLDFGPAQFVRGRKAGTITWLPAPGTEIDRGRTLYKVDNRPVSLFFGDTPLWRKLDVVGTKGPDVTIVKSNLAALGYLAGGKGDMLTPATKDAIKRWQKAMDVEATGVLDAGDVVVLPGKVRVAEIATQLSAPADGELMSITAPGKAVTASVDVAQVGAFKRGTKVTIALPDGKEIAGTVGRISTKAEGGGKDDTSGGGQQERAMVSVEVRLDKAATVGALDSGPVRIRIGTNTKRGVLTVPVTALLALREGGYAVQARDGGRTTLLAVKTGMFAGGLVEISGDGVREGLPVVTTS
jgi:peptidoglycan hydrolase-like protein with peptidoglycan-binding domain